MWQVYAFNLVAALLITGWYLRAVRRLERRMDERLLRFGVWADAQEARINAWADEEEAKYDIARDEIKASMRAQVDASIAEIESQLGGQSTGRVIEVRAENTLKFTQSAEARLTGVPTEGEIRELPRWARVAFAARCARRALPLVKRYWKGAPEHHLKALLRAVSVAENADDDADAVGAAYDAVGAGIDADAARAATRGARGAARAAQAARADYAGTDYAYDAYDDAAYAVYGVVYTTAARIIRRDLEIVLGLAKANYWNDATPVLPSMFGPLWPEGAPKDWPKPENPATELVFTFDVPDGMTTADAIELVKELSAALCELDLAGGGRGLAIQPPLEITAPVRIGCSV